MKNCPLYDIFSNLALLLGELLKAFTPGIEVERSSNAGECRGKSCMWWVSTGLNSNEGYCGVVEDD